MRITYSPVEGLPAAEMSVEGETLTINGTDYDFSALGEGEIIPFLTLGEPLIVSDVTRVAGVVEITVILPHGPSAITETRFPDPVEIMTDGPISLPEYDDTLVGASG